jgi:hypothetical protein
VSHDDNLRRLKAKFEVANRYANFGPGIQPLEIRGFRGIKDLTLPVQSPITALSGLSHRDPGSPGPGALGDPLPEPHGGEGGLD